MFGIFKSRRPPTEIIEGQAIGTQSLLVRLVREAFDVNIEQVTLKEATYLALFLMSRAYFIYSEDEADREIIDSAIDRVLYRSISEYRSSQGRGQIIEEFQLRFKEYNILYDQHIEALQSQNTSGCLTLMWFFCKKTVPDHYSEMKYQMSSLPMSASGITRDTLKLYKKEIR